MPILVSLDSIIGAGKSTLLDYFERNVKYVRSYRVVVVKEDVNDWVQNGILKQYYEDPERYAFCFQLYVLLSRSRLLEKAVKTYPDALILSERTQSSDYMFALMLYETKKIN